MSIRCRAVAWVALGVSACWCPPSPGGDRPRAPSIVLGGVTYRAGVETRREQNRTVLVHATVEAVEPGADRPAWTLNLRQGPPIAGHETPVRSFRPFLDGLIVETGSAHYYVDPAARTSEEVIDRVGERGDCGVHHRPLLEDLVRVRYGLVRGGPSMADRQGGFPNAALVCTAGCVVRDARRAAVLYCPDCRAAERAWVDRAKGPAK